jgi:ribosomal protein L16/L10AE
LGSAVGSQRPGTHKIGCTYFFISSVPKGRVIFEIGGAPVREELARDGKLCCSLVEFLLIVHAALRQAGDKLPTTTEFIDRKTPLRLGNLLLTPEVKERLESSSTRTSS